jgi:polysaccharide biosynthesis transport protein
MRRISEPYERVAGLAKPVAPSVVPMGGRDSLAYPTHVRRVPSASSTHEDSVLVDAFAFFRRHWISILSLPLLGAALGLLIAAVTTPTYRATATLEIQNINDNFLNLKEVTPLVPSVDPTISTDVPTQLRILRSNTLLDRTLSRMRSERVPVATGFAAQVQGWLAKLPGRATSAKAPVSTQTDRLRQAGDNLRLTETRQARIVDLAYESPDPEYAATFVNTLAREYMDQSVEQRTTLSESTSNFLHRQLQDTRAKLGDSQRRLQEYAQRTGLLMNGDNRAPAAEKLRQIQTNLTEAEAARMAKQARLETIAAAPADSVDTVTGGPKRDYNRQLAELRRQRADLLTVFQPDYAGVQRLESQIASLEAALKTESLTVVQDARNEFNDASRRENLLRDSYVDQTQLVTKEAESAIQYSMLKNEADANQRVYEMILENTASANVAAAMRASNARLVDPARVPDVPFRPSRSTNVMWGGTAGLLLGLIVANARERLDRRIKRPGQLGAQLDIPELGRLPSGALNSARNITLPPGKGVKLTVDEKKSQAIAESCRSILTSILFSDEVARVPQVLVVTSALKGEGKTTLVTNLAASLARMNRRVLVIDGDLRHPQLHGVLDTANDYGLSDLLTLTSSDEEGDLIGYVAQPTSLGGVYLLAAGPSDHRAVDLLYSSEMLKLLNHARDEFDTILIDTPAMLEWPDARILGRMADGVVLVVRAGGTTRDEVLAAKVRLEEDRTALLGTVLNHGA